MHKNGRFFTILCSLVALALIAAASGPVGYASVDQVEILPDGHIQIRMRKMMPVGDQERNYGFHRTVMPPGGDVVDVIEAVNQHLSSMGFDDGVDGDDPLLERLVSVIPVVQTPVAVAESVARRAEPLAVPQANPVIKTQATIDQIRLQADAGIRVIVSDVQTGYFDVSCDDDLGALIASANRQFVARGFEPIAEDETRRLMSIVAADRRVACP